MNVNVNLDKRGKVARMYDEMLNTMKRDAKLTPMQFAVVGRYIRKVIGLRIHEVEAATEMSYLIALIESEKFGTAAGATRIPRVQAKACEARNEAYGHSCIDANGMTPTTVAVLSILRSGSQGTV